ncbi:MAG: hypothetical protein M0T84_01315 [Betaproteobacteria bacterium]|nr:hypothetical protein [Betaproteobacteria bacterium]
MPYFRLSADDLGYAVLVERWQTGTASGRNRRERLVRRRHEGSVFFLHSLLAPREELEQGIVVRRTSTHGA